MVHPKARNGLVLKSSRSSFDNLGNLSGRRSLSFNVEMVGRNLPIHTPKVVEDVAPGSVMLHNMAQEVQPENKKGRYLISSCIFCDYPKNVETITLADGSRC